MHLIVSPFLICPRSHIIKVKEREHRRSIPGPTVLILKGRHKVVFCLYLLIAAKTRTFEGEASVALIQAPFFCHDAFIAEFHMMRRIIVPNNRCACWDIFLDHPQNFSVPVIKIDALKGFCYALSLS